MENVGMFIAIWNIWQPFGIFCVHLVYLVSIWYILWSIGTFCGRLVYFVVIWFIFSVLVCCTQKNLATLLKVPKYSVNTNTISRYIEHVRVSGTIISESFSCSKLQSVNDGIVQESFLGWPEWVKFPPLCGCLLSAGFFEITEVVSKRWATFFHRNT
jgi:hypothetical protein